MQVVEVGGGGAASPIGETIVRREWRSSSDWLKLAFTRECASLENTLKREIGLKLFRLF